MTEQTFVLSQATADDLNELIRKYINSPTDFTDGPPGPNMVPTEITFAEVGTKVDSYPMYNAIIFLAHGSTRTYVSQPGAAYVVDLNQADLALGTITRVTRAGDYNGLALYISDTLSSSGYTGDVTVVTGVSFNAGTCSLVVSTIVMHFKHGLLQGIT